MERVYQVKNEAMPAALLFIYSFKVNSEGKQVDVAEKEGSMEQDYYLISSSWKRNCLQVELHKLRLPYSRPSDKESLREEVYAEEIKKLNFTRAESRKLSLIAGSNFKNFVVSTNEIVL